MVSKLLAPLFAALLLFLAPAARAADWVSPAPSAASVRERVLVPEGWESARGAWLDVHGVPDSAPVLVALARHGSESIPRIAETLAVPIGEPVDVFVAPSQAAFEALQPGNAPDWADGTAYPAISAVFLKRPALRGVQPRPLEMVLDHELVHVLLGRAFLPNDPPTWLQEGLAQVIAGEHDPSVVDTLARGAVGGLLTLDEITLGFPRDAQRARLAYAQSADLVAFLRAEHGDASLRVLVRELAAGSDIRRAVRLATGRSLEDLDAAWRARFTEISPLWVTSVLSQDALWAAAALAAVVALVLARRRVRRRMEAYARDEARRDALIASLTRRWLDMTSGRDDTVH